MKTNSHKWTNILRNITAGYNNTYHRSIGMTPTQALETNDVTLWKKLYTTPLKKKSISKGIGARKINPYKFGIGDTVKLAHMKETFANEYDFKWTEEHFFISGRTNEGHIPQYSIKDGITPP